MVKEQNDILLENLTKLVQINERMEWLLASRLAAKLTNDESVSQPSQQSQEQGGGSVSEVRVANVVPTIITQQPIRVSARLVTDTSSPDSGNADPTQYLIVRLTDGTNFVGERSYLYVPVNVASVPATIVSGVPDKKIRVYSLTLNSVGMPVFRFEDGSGQVLTGYFSPPTNGTIHASFEGGLFETSSGQSLIITASTFNVAADRVRGMITYALI